MLMLSCNIQCSNNRARNSDTRVFNERLLVLRKFGKKLSNINCTSSSDYIEKLLDMAVKNINIIML